MPDVSDHRLVRAKVRLHFFWPKKQKKLSRLNFEQLTSSHNSTVFQLELKNRFETLCNKVDTEIIPKLSNWHP